jgi:hypothetical protein
MYISSSMRSMNVCHYSEGEEARYCSDLDATIEPGNKKVVSLQWRKTRDSITTKPTSENTN